MIEKKFPMRRVQSFVRRDSRMTDAQKRALDELLPQFGLNVQDGAIDLSNVFHRKAKTCLEIGFGSGYSLLEMAKAHPLQNFIGIETHLPGIGLLLQGIERAELQNIRVYYADAVEVLERCIQDSSLDVVQIFFPDPWPKRKHHKRRLIQENFIQRVCAKLKENGTIHLATDWQHYALHMMKVLSNVNGLQNKMGAGQYSDRSLQRPVMTKFEQRGRECGREIWELQFIKY
ncbi:MAG TPA: tRNA (guanosine(46)-N7)-methyltransferase TrmB [Gammaproteobacteria bacterium]|nr:tRNA (guanosine(46)-N7)-methyltransferase TrmB [Gammaproteobacteria bacterium]